MIDGGSPTSFGGANIDTLNVAPSGATTVSAGATPDAGAVVSGNGTVNYVGIERVAFTGAAGTALTINGTNANDAINQVANVVTVNAGAPIDFTAGGFTILTIDGQAGDDVINVYPATLTGITGTFTVKGGDPTGSDTLIVNGSAVAADDAFIYDPTGSVSVNGAATAFTGIELVKINGLGAAASGDTVAVTAPTFTPGAAQDSGGVLVNNLTPMSFSNLRFNAANPGLLTLNAGAGSTLAYNGTANNDVFAVTGLAAPVRGQVALTGYLPVQTNASVTTLALNGLDGDDTLI